MSDFAAQSIGTGIIKGNGSGGNTPAVPDVDYRMPKIYALLVLAVHTFTLDFLNALDAIFENITALTANFIIVHANDSKAQSFDFKIKLNGTGLTMTCPSNWTMPSGDANWNSGTQVYTFTGAQANKYFLITGKYNAARTKWEVTVSSSDFV